MRSRNNQQNKELVQIVEAIRPHAPRLHELFAEGLEFLRLALGAQRVSLNRDGDVLDLGPDYRVRTTALNLLVSLYVLGKTPQDNVVPSSNTMTRTQLRAFVAEEVRLGNLGPEMIEAFR